MDKKEYEELFNNINSCIAIYEAVENANDFIIRDFNKAAEKADKIKREDIIGKSVLKVFPGIKDFGLFDVFKRVYKTGKPENLPISIYSDNRLSVWRENFVYKTSKGEIVAIYTDATAKKQAEEEIKSLAKFPEENPNPVGRIDYDGKLLITNEPTEILCVSRDVSDKIEEENLLKKMVAFAEELLKTGSEQVTYQKILQNLLYISKAKY